MSPVKSWLPRQKLLARKNGITGHAVSEQFCQSHLNNDSIRVGISNNVDVTSLDVVEGRARPSYRQLRPWRP